MRRKDTLDSSGGSIFPREQSVSSLESGTYPQPGGVVSDGTGKDGVTDFVARSNETKLLARKLAIETEKFKRLQNAALEEEVANGSESKSAVEGTALAQEIELSSKECVKLSNTINERLLELSQDTQETAERGKGLTGSAPDNNPSVQRMKGGINAALHCKFSDQINEFQKDVIDIRRDYTAKNRNNAPQVQNLDSMIELCMEICEENPALNDREGLDKWNRLDEQVEMFYPKEPASPAQETQPLLTPVEEPLYPPPSARPPPEYTERTMDLEQQTVSRQSYLWQRRPFLFAFYVILGVIILIVIYILVQTYIVWKKQSKA